METLDSHVNELKQKETELLQEVNGKRLELERTEKRLESFNNAQPAHLQEINQFEHELSVIFKIYVEKIRNHDYLQSRVDKYQKLEEINKKNLKVLIDQNKQNDQKYIHDQNEQFDENNDEEEEADNQNQEIGPDEEGGEGMGDNDDDLQEEDDDHF